MRAEKEEKRGHRVHCEDQKKVVVSMDWRSCQGKGVVRVQILEGVTWKVEWLEGGMRAFEFMEGLQFLVMRETAVCEGVNG